MVIAKVPVEVVLVAPIWRHCGIQSHVKAVITPSVVVRPIIAHIHILVVVEAFSGLIVSNDSSVFSVDVSSSTVQRGGKVTVDSSRGLLGTVLSSCFVNFWMGFDEKPRGLLQLVLLIRRCPRSPCLWLTILPLYKKGSVFNHLVTGLRFTSRILVFTSMRPEVSTGCVLSYLVFERTIPPPTAPTTVKRIEEQTRNGLTKKELCFTCEEHWEQGHRYLGKGQVHYIEVVSNEEEAGYETDEPEQQQVAEEQIVEYEPEQLPEGNTGASEGTLADLSGAPRYHLFRGLVAKRRLKAENFSGFNVTIADGFTILCIKTLILNERIQNLLRLRSALVNAEEHISKIPGDTPYAKLQHRLQEMGPEKGWGDQAERVLDMIHLLSEILQAPDPSALEKFLGGIPMVFSAAILSPHGYFGQANVLGLPDTGEQVVYILDQVCALESEMILRVKQQGLDIIPQILVVTRLIPEAQGTTCNQQIEKISGMQHAQILRVPFRTENGILCCWVSRFDVWPYLERFAEDMSNEIAAELKGQPDFIIGNYSDGNLVASLIAYKLGISQYNIVHALEKTKYPDLDKRRNFLDDVPSLDLKTGMQITGALQLQMNQYMAAIEGPSNTEKMDFKSYKGLVKLRCLQADQESIVNAYEAIKMLQRVLSQDHGSSEGVENFLLLPGLACTAYSGLIDEISSVVQPGGITHFSSKKLAKLYFKFAFFCDELLASTKYQRWGCQVQSQTREGNPSIGLPHSCIYPTLVVKHIMRAVQLNNSMQVQHGIAKY
eukprot:Gb_28190 [translate_table: standard]